jgi:hypothetical protein
MPQIMATTGPMTQKLEVVGHGSRGSGMGSPKHSGPDKVVTYFQR